MVEDALPVRARTQRGPFLVAAVLATVLLSTAVVLGVRALGGPEAFLARFGPFAPLVGVIVIALAGLQPFPGGEVLLVAQGALFGAALGGAVCLSGSTAVATIRYRLARWLTGGTDLDEVRMPAWLRRLPVGHPAFQILVRQLPLGGFAIDLASPAAGVSALRHHTCAAIGAVPGSWLFAAIGARLVSW